MNQKATQSNEADSTASSPSSQAHPLAGLEADSEPTGARQSRLISGVLTPAVRLWLRSQVEQIEDLHVQISGGDRQLLSGHIPQVSLAASNAVYQGLHLSQVQLTGANIRINLGQVLRGKPLRLLEVVPVTGELRLHQTDLNTSLQAPLLANALNEFLFALLKSSASTGWLEDSSDASPDETTWTLQNPKVLIGEGQLTLSGTLLNSATRPMPLTLRTGLQLVNGHQLQLVRPEFLTHLRAKRGLLLNDLDGFQIDLGREVNLQTLTLQDEQIICQGCINVVPA